MAHQLGELEEVGDPPRMLERLVEVGPPGPPLRPAHVDVLPELLAQGGHLCRRVAQSRGIARHAAPVPHAAPQLAVELVDAAPTVHRQQTCDPFVDVPFDLAHGSVTRGRGREPRRREIVADGVGQDKIAVGEPLHQGARAQAVGTVVGAVRFADHEQPREGAHQVVVHPQAAHRVVRRGIDPHRDPVGVLSGDALVHLEQVTVALGDHAPAIARDGVAQIEVHAVASRPDAAPLVADVLGAPRRDVAWHQVAVARVQSLEVIVALCLGDLVRPPAVGRTRRHPDAPVVAQGLAHQRELRLMVPRRRDAGRVDLREAGVRERGTPLVGAPDRRDVAPLRVGREVIDVAVPTGGEDHGVADVRIELAADEVADDDAAGRAVDYDQVQHFVPRVHPDLAAADVPREGLVGTEQQLLARLAAGVEGARHLHAAERAVREQAPVLPGERDALRDALVDDVDAQLRQAIHVRLARAEVAALQRVVEQPEHGVAVVLVVLGRVDPALGGDRMRAPGRVLEAEAGDVVAELGERGGRRGARQPRADDEDMMLRLVRGGDQPNLGPVPRPLGLERSGGDAGVQLHGQRSTPASTAAGIEM